MDKALVRLRSLVSHIREDDPRPANHRGVVQSGTAGSEAGDISDDARQPGAEEYDQAVSAYREDGVRRALELGNRGPIAFDSKGRLCADILEKYEKCGFYVFTGVISAEELSDLKEDLQHLLDQAPVEKDGTVDQYGNPVPHPEIYRWAPALSDPLGGTAFGVYNFRGGKTKGRHHVKMTRPVPLPGSPAYIIENITNPLAHMDSSLRLYGHPDLLRVAESINGPDFTPFIENWYIKPARLGTSTAWHQDPSSAWDEEWKKPNFDYGTCGFSFHASLGRCTAANGLWAVPGSHRWGRVDIKALANRSGGSDLLPDAVPILCEPGDVYMHNRLSLHGAFPNTSDEPRITMQFGFHRRASVLGVQNKGYAVQPKQADFGGKPTFKVYNDAFIHERSKMIVWAIDARRQRFSHETPYVYRPFAGLQESYPWTPELKKNMYDRLCCGENSIVI